MVDKVIYFTAGEVPTSGELQDIEKINSVAERGYIVNVSNGSVDSGLGGIEACNYVAGSIPDEYAEVPVFDVDAPPIPNLPETAAVVYDGDIKEIAVTGEYTDSVQFTVVDGVISAIVLS